MHLMLAPSRPLFTGGPKSSSTIRGTCLPKFAANNPRRLPALPTQSGVTGVQRNDAGGKRLGRIRYGQHRVGGRIPSAPILVVTTGRFLRIASSTLPLRQRQNAGHTTWRTCR